ncbi:MAG: EF-P lysine aminoacylase EpmA [Gammaproteobacteria bacterium]
MSDTWRPYCSLEHLQFRAQMLADIRRFFYERGVLEVETPLLSRGIGTDPQLAFFSTEFDFSPEKSTLYLQTSPEFAMKRLLAAGSGSIYQICKAFRNGESGRFHNPEFTLLEWYRTGFDLFDLMAEIEQLIRAMFASFRPIARTEMLSYREAFERFTGLNPLVFDRHGYSDCASAAGFPEAEGICGDSHEAWLDFLFSHCIQPNLGLDGLCMIYAFPACQSSLARLNADDPAVTDRVEIFIQGVELGNGYFELADAEEQERRFQWEIDYRRRHGLPAVEKDNRLLNALASGLPDCSGMAIGLDRLLMLATGAEAIDQVLAFPIARA